MRPHTVEPEYLAVIAQAIEEGVTNGKEAGAKSLQPIAFTARTIPKRGAAPLRIRAEVLRRDSFTCRYCNLPTIPTPILELLGDLYPNLFPYHRNWLGGATHPAVALLSPIIDHIEPGSRDGAWLASDNLATACNPCNTIKRDYTLAELGWELLPPTQSNWDGLTSYYPALWTAAERPNPNHHARWMRSLGLNPG